MMNTPKRRQEKSRQGEKSSPFSSLSFDEFLMNTITSELLIVTSIFIKTSKIKSISSLPGVPGRCNPLKLYSMKIIDKDKSSDINQSGNQQSGQSKRRDYYVDWSPFHTKEPPFPDMHFDAGMFRWVPNNRDEFEKKHGAEFDEVVAVYLAEYNTNTSAPISKAPKKPSKKESAKSQQSDSDQVTKANEVTERKPRMLRINMIDTDEGPGANDSPAIASDTEPSSGINRKSQPKGNVVAEPIHPPMPNIATPTVETAPTIATETTTPTIVTDTTTVEGADQSEAVQPSDSGQEHEQVQPEKPKATRISAKMRRASRDEICRLLVPKVKTDGGSPITITAEVLKLVRKIITKSGDYKTCPTYVINNLLLIILRDMEEDINAWPIPD